MNIVEEQRRKLSTYLAQIERELTKLYGRTCMQVVQIQDIRNAVDSGVNFTWSENPQAQKQTLKFLQMYADKASMIITSAVEDTYNRGIDGAQAKITYMSGAKSQAEKDALQQVTAQAIEDRRQKGMDGHKFAMAERGGLTISQRVWNTVGNAQKEIEVLIQNAVKTGASADDLSREVRKYLQNPDSLFRRVRNKETGELELSEAAQNFHSGRGVYRSAYKNAMRLARTEVQNAYRAAEWESYQSNPLVIGIRIELSNNHTCLDSKGVARPFTDICDELQGVYPKTFKWSGWHPQCRCVMLPELAPQSYLKNLVRARREARHNGEDPDKIDMLSVLKDKNVSTPTMPAKFGSWLDKNETRIKTAHSLPEWIKDNPTQTGNIPTPKQTPQQIANARHAKRTIDDINRTQNEWNKHRLAEYASRYARLGIESPLIDKLIKSKNPDLNEFKQRVETLERSIARHKARTQKDVLRITNAANNRSAKRYFENIDDVINDIVDVSDSNKKRSVFDLIEAYSTLIRETKDINKQSLYYGVNMAMKNVVNNRASAAVIQTLKEEAMRIQIENGAVRLSPFQQFVIFNRQSKFVSSVYTNTIHSGESCYIGTNNSMNINGVLADYKGKGANAYKKAQTPKLEDLKGIDGRNNGLIREQSIVTIEHLDKAIAKSLKLPFNVYVTRMLDDNGIKGVFNINVTGTDEMIAKSLQNAIKKSGVGIVHGYTSVSTEPDLNVFDNRSFFLEGIVPAGTRMYYSLNFRESECILPRNTKIVPTSTKVESIKMKGSVKFRIKVRYFVSSSK